MHDTATRMPAVVQEYVGTLRWTADTELPPLPRTPQIGPLHGWTDFLAERLCGTPLMRDGVLHIPSAAMIDGTKPPTSVRMHLEPALLRSAPLDSTPCMLASQISSCRSCGPAG